MTITRSAIAGSIATLALLLSPVVTNATAAPSVSITTSETSISATAKLAYANLPTISWSSTNATSCTASGSGWSGVVATSGSQKVRPSITTTYTLTCTGAGGSATQGVTINVVVPILQTASVLDAFAQATPAAAPVPTNPTNNQATTFSYVWNTDLTVGSSNTADISALQTALTLQGVYTGPVTGGFYSLTLAGVKAFQTKYGISATGYVGPITRAKLNALY